MDRREQILVQLEVVAKTVADHVFRNQVEIPEGERPAVVILDGDEIADEADNARKRPPLAPRIVAMTPGIYAMLGDLPKDVGPAVNTFRSRLIKAILSDESLVALCHDGDIRYSGLVTGLALGRSMEAELSLGMTFRYVLRPDKL